MKIADHMSYPYFDCIDFFDSVSQNIANIRSHGGFIIYMDPPYKCSTILDHTNSNSKNSFDFVKFWKYAELLAENNLVFVSETEVPSSKWKKIWEKTFHNISNNRQYSRVEGLYTFNNDNEIC